MAGNLGCCGYWLADVHIENWRVNILMDSRASSHGGIAHVRVLGIQRCLRRGYWTGCLLTRIRPLLQQKQNNGHHDNSHEPLIIAGKPMHQATPPLPSLSMPRLEVNAVYVSAKNRHWREIREEDWR